MQISLDQLIVAAIRGTLEVEGIAVEPTPENIAAEAFRLGIFDSDKMNWEEGVKQVHEGYSTKAAYAGQREHSPEEIDKVFCPTGEGGGIDPTCSPTGSFAPDAMPHNFPEQDIGDQFETRALDAFHGHDALKTAMTRVPGEDLFIRVVRGKSVADDIKQGVSSAGQEGQTEKGLSGFQIATGWKKPLGWQNEDSDNALLDGLERMNRYVQWRKDSLLVIYHGRLRGVGSDNEDVFTPIRAIAIFKPGEPPPTEQ